MEPIDVNPLFNRTAKVLDDDGDPLKVGGGVAKGKETSGKSSGVDNAATYPKLKESLTKQNPILSAAVKGDNGKLNYGIGSGTKAEADRLGKIWVGNGAKPATDGKGLVSADGLRVFRYPDVKPNAPQHFNPTGIQANFETYKINPSTGERMRIGNGHMSIEK